MPNGTDDTGGFGGTAWWLHQEQPDPDTGIVPTESGDWIDLETGELIESGYYDYTHDPVQEFGWGDFLKDQSTTVNEGVFNFALLLGLALLVL